MDLRKTELGQEKDDQYYKENRDDQMAAFRSHKSYHFGGFGTLSKKLEQYNMAVNCLSPESGGRGARC